LKEQISISPANKVASSMPMLGVDNKEAIQQKSRQASSFNIQFKLSVGAVSDPLEDEADAMADKIMRTPEQNFIQRKCAECEKEEKVQRKPLTSFIQMKQSSFNNNVVASDSVSHQIQSTKGGGNAMPETTKSFMESRFGADFSNVNIHTGSYASQLSHQLNAQAFTIGNNIYFNEGKYSPESSDGKHLLAHELTHTVQQGDTFTAANNTIQRQEGKRLEEIKEKLKKGEKLTEDEMQYVREQIGKEIVQQLFGNTAQIGINYDSSRPPQDINRHFHGRLQLQLSGLAAGVAKSLDGVATAEIDLKGTVATEKGVITIAPPTEKNRMAALIREQLFPNGSVRSFDFHFSKKNIGYANAISLISGITVSISSKNGSHTGGMISIDSESVPSGVELIVTLEPSARTANVEDIKQELPNDHWTLTPKPDIFGTAGYASANENNGAVTTIGVDVPLGYDTKTPLIYGGLGARAGIDSNRIARVGGTGFVGLNFDPLKLQLGFGAGVAFLKDPVATKDGPAQIVFYSDVEGKVSYKIMPHVEVLGLLSVGGGKNLTYGSAQAGVGFTF
jgi:hypothetical protein